jgi:hypothetical protein
MEAARPELSPETVRALLRECVTVVRPGEVLAVRLPVGMTCADVARAQAITQEVAKSAGIQAVALVGEEFAVAEPR